MKGLVLTHMGRREEGLEFVKKGVRLDLTSHIVWHVFGLIQKGEKNYEEALKSYTQALKFDKVRTPAPQSALVHSLAVQENMNILRDAAHLQTQLRQYDGLVETRHTLLRLRPNLRSNWLGLAVAYHLDRQLDEAKKILEHYEASLKVRSARILPETDATCISRTSQIMTSSTPRSCSTTSACLKISAN